MVKERMDLLELLRKGGMDGDVDFLRCWRNGWPERRPANGLQHGSPSIRARYRPYNPPTWYAVGPGDNTGSPMMSLESRWPENARCSRGGSPFHISRPG